MTRTELDDKLSDLINWAIAAATDEDEDGMDTPGTEMSRIRKEILDGFDELSQ